MRCKLCLKVVRHPSVKSKEIQVCGACSNLRLILHQKPFNHVEHPEIPYIKQISSNGKRHYETPYGDFISITAMLHQLPSAPGLAEWRERVGDDVANYAMRLGGIRGTRLHNAVETYLKNEPMQNMKQSYGVTATGLFELMQPALDNIDNIREIEQRLFSQKLELAGTTDCVAEYDGVLSIIDFKSSTYMKNRDSITDYFIQATFYSLAWEELTGEKIEQIVIIMAAEDGQMQVFTEQRSNYIESLKQAIVDYKAMASDQSS